MWYLLDRFGRPSLARHLQLRALELNQRALRLLSADCGSNGGLERARELVAVTVAGEASWQVLRGALEETPQEPGWRSVKAGLEAQTRLLRPLETLADSPPGEDMQHRVHEHAWPLAPKRRQRLQDSLLDQSRWLGMLVQRPATPQALLEAHLVRVYRKAGRDLHGQPYRRRAGRRLRRLLALLELIGAGSGLTMQDRLAAMALSGRYVQRMLLEHRRLTEQIAAARSRRRVRTLKRRRRDIARAMNHEVARHFSEQPRQFADRLSWELFCGLLEQPERRDGAAPVDFGARRRLNAHPSDAAGPIEWGAVRFGENAC